MIARLKTKLWIEAHTRTCFAADHPAFVVAKGDVERGGVLLKINRFKEGILVLEQSSDLDGNKVWRKVGVFPASDEREADARIAKKRAFDSDLWVLEIEDMQASYEPDAPVSEF